jgi:hypothetical protein
MRNGITVENVNINDGIYDGLWSAYELKILGPRDIVLATLKTIEGVRGINCPVKLNIKNGVVYEISKYD